MSAHHEVESSFSESPQLCRKFTFSEIQLATQNLDESLVIGRGGFGKVYKGTITNGADLVTAAIKRLDSNSNQGASEFWAEVNMLSNLRHCHLVSLIGYCNDEQEMILVYEYMSHGTLEDHLHKCQTPLSWVQRLTICIGAARGLDYLHTGTGIKQGVVHRDVKTSNILLHDSWEAKISDFGLSKICPKNQQSTYVNTMVKGTFGYLDPDYFYTGKLTRKSDVYAFGVVLFEVLCRKRAVDRSIGEEQWALAVWAQESIKEGRLKEIVDTNIRGGISPKCLKKFSQFAKRCLHQNPKQRPAMAEVVVGLESILALQEEAGNTLQPTGLQFFAKKALMVMGGLNFSKADMNSLNQTLHWFDFDAINFATENFSKANMIMRLTGYECVYKGKLQNGQGIVVTRFSSAHSIARFMTEASVLLKLEHENLAKLLGYSINGTTFFLVYDFSLHAAPNCLMFDSQCSHLNWDKRYKILLGVAKAVLYLHMDAPIQIICNVKLWNILLDENLNPIMSGFLDTRYGNYCRTMIFGGVGHYEAPEYSCYAGVSTKADVYSFGALLLETITGNRTPDFWSAHKNIEKNWLEGTLSNITDPRIDMDSSSMTSFFEIGLLCVREDAKDRPTMDEVVSMLIDSSPLPLLVAKMRDMITSQCSNSTTTPVDDQSYNTSGDDDYDYGNGADYYDYDTDVGN